MLKKIKNRLNGEAMRNFGSALGKLLSGRFDGYADAVPIMAYFFGHRTALRLCYWNLLKKHAEDGHFSFGGVLLPQVDGSSLSETASFLHDFLNIVRPALPGHCNYSEEGPYEYGGVKIEKGDVVIDAGANIGMFSALAASRGAVVYAFEPSAEVRKKYLETTARLNGNIHVSPLALSDKNGWAGINLEKDNLVAASMVIKRSGSVERIQTVTLDSFVERRGIPRVDFIKIDIEGAERLLLSGARNVLRKYGPKLAVCTYHLPDDKTVLPDLILKANPDYKITHNWLKLYAEVPSPPLRGGGSMW